MHKLFTHSLVLVGLASSFPLVAGFEAHVVNVTAKIENNVRLCEARSKGFWSNNEGCFQGAGESPWVDEVAGLSAQYSGVFAEFTEGSEICSAIWTPNCNVSGQSEARICRAKTHLLADLLNLVSGKLILTAFIAGADDGDSAFDNLGLSEFSTIDEALRKVEETLMNPASSKNKISDAGYVAMRIYEFYENENPFSPQCITDPDDVPLCRKCLHCGPTNINIEIQNNASVITEITITANTGGNTATGTDAVIETGDATASTTIVNIINETEISIESEPSEPEVLNATTESEEEVDEPVGNNQVDNLEEPNETESLEPSDEDPEGE